MPNHSYQRGSFSVEGMLLFVVAFVATIIFFGYTLAVNPGPIDTGGQMVPVRFSKVQNDERLTAWKQKSAENITYGQDVYRVNCNYCHNQNGKDAVLEKLSGGAPGMGLKPLELYTFLRKGISGQHRFDFVPEREKFALVAYMKSVAKNDSDNSSGEWQKFLKEGLY